MAHGWRLEIRRSTLTALHLLVVLGHIVRPNGAQETNVIVRMEFRHLIGGGLVRTLCGNIFIVRECRRHASLEDREEENLHRFPSCGTVHS